MFTIRVENVYPSGIDAVVNQLAGYGGEHRVVISHDGAMDELLIRVEASSALHADGDVAISTFRHQLTKALQKILGLRAKVEIVAPATFPRTDFKAKRVLDDRELFRDMQQRLDGG